MVARGDLGIEVPMEQLPAYTKRNHQKMYSTSSTSDSSDPDDG